jgi:hypothetical protein
MVSRTTQRQRVLVIGSSGSTGTKIVHALSEQLASKRPIITSFCEQPSNLDQFTKERCNRVIQGDFQCEADIERAMNKSKADIVILAPLMEHSNEILIASPSLRYALEAVLRRPAYRHVALIVVEDTSSSSSSSSTESTIQRQKRNTPKLEEAKRGLSEFWAVLQSLTCFMSKDMLRTITDETSSFTVPSLKKASSSNVQSRDSSDSNMTTDKIGIERSVTMVDDLTRPNPSRIKVDKETFIDFVVGAVMDSDSLSSLNGSGHNREFIVSTE